MNGRSALLIVGAALVVGCGGSAPDDLFPPDTIDAPDAGPARSDPSPAATPVDASVPIPHPTADASIADATVGASVDATVDAPAPVEEDSGPVYLAAQFVSQSFPFASSALTMTAGDTIPSYIELRNVGNAPWTSSTQLATTEPRDRASAFADSTWISPSRAAVVNGTVAPGDTYKFAFDLRAPKKPGTYFEYFDLVDGDVWFGDPGQGGPPDDNLEVQVVVVPKN